MRRVLAGSLLITGVAITHLVAQARPDFSGEWRPINQAAAQSRPAPILLRPLRRRVRSRS